MEWINPQADKDGPVQKPQYDDYRKMICHLAGNYARTYGNGYDMPFDKLISEGYLVFTRCAGKWNGKTTFSTYLYSCLQGRYKDLLKQERRLLCQPGNAAAQGDASASGDELLIDLLSTIQTLSDDAQFCIKVIWETPADLYRWAVTERSRPAITLKLLRRYLRTFKWTYSRINDCFTEIKTALR